VDEVAALWRDLLAYHREIGEKDVRLATALSEGREFIKEHIGPKDRLCIVAESGGTAVGFLVATLRRRSPTFGGWRYGHVYDAYVKGPFRRRGVGTKLVEEAFRWFRRHGVRRVQLQVRARNVAGLRFWKDLKFDDLAKTLERRV